MRKKLLIVAVVAAALLLIPLFFTLTGSGVDGVGFHWTLIDFVVMFGLLFAAGAVYTGLTLKADSTLDRVVIGAFVFLLFLALWAELAVDAISNALSTLSGWFS